MELIIDGCKSRFYQWDTGQRLIVIKADACSEVHFRNRHTENALVVRIEMENGMRVANVPNILLQTDDAITAYLICLEDGETETRYAKTFVVRRREKPESYVYTETEVLNYSSLVARIDQIEQNGVSDEQIAAAVEDYLAENPAGVNFETDGTTLILNDGVLSVNTTDKTEQDNTRPITSAGVFATVGNIEALLKTI